MRTTLTPASTASTSRSAICSRRAWRALHGAALVGVLLAIAPGPARAKVLVTAEDAVREAFPDARAERRTDYLTEEQSAKIQTLAGSPPSSRIVISWRGVKDEHLLGTAYLETHVVRTLPETILVIVDPEGR